MNKYPVDNIVTYDLEVFPGWFEAGFELPDEKIYQIVVTPGAFDAVDQLRAMLKWLADHGYTLAGFNSRGYDDLVLTGFLADPDPATAYAISQRIIAGGEKPWTFDNEIQSIDLMPILPGRMSLKKIGVCLGHPKLQELPVPWDQTPTWIQQQTLLGYNGNDLQITRKLCNTLKADLELRSQMSDQYGVDLRSMGEATMAEAILFAEYKKLGGQLSKRQLNERAHEILVEYPYAQVKTPSWWSELAHKREQGVVEALGEDIFNTDIEITESGRLSSAQMTRQIYLDDRYYTMGVGGLHSVDGPGCWVPGPDEQLFDIDVASYYPNIILTQDLAPRTWGDEFRFIYRTIVERRMHAKRTGDSTTAQILKIVANGTYGKSSEPFSCIYDPQMTANVTVLGQLGLLMLISMLEGIATVCSANTDGITVLVKRNRFDDLADAVIDWEKATGFEMEYTEYAGLYQRDVNNYIALTTDGNVKTKGVFVSKWPDLRHMPSANIIARAIIAKLQDDVPIAETVHECHDINQFILTQNVTGGWTTSWNGQRLGKVLRFYKSNREDAAPIIRTPGENDAGNESKVSDSDGCVPLEDYPEEFPSDMNRYWYVDQALKLLDVITQPKRPGLTRWAESMHMQGLSPCTVNPESGRSRAAVRWGTEDFTSMPEGWMLGTKTGDGLLAIRHGEYYTDLIKVDRDYPAKSRAKVKKDHGLELVYGARVPLPGFYTVRDLDPTVSFDEYYTPAELKRVGR